MLRDEEEAVAVVHGEFEQGGGLGFAPWQDSQPAILVPRLGERQGRRDVRCPADPHMRLILPRAVGREFDDLRVDARSCKAALVRCLQATAIRIVYSPSRPIVKDSPPAMSVIPGGHKTRRPLSPRADRKSGGEG